MDDSQVATAIASPHLYLPGDRNYRTFTVRAIDGFYYTDSNSVTVTDNFLACAAPVQEVTAEA